MLSLEDLDTLEELMESLVNIHSILHNVIRDYTKTKISDYAKRASYFPLIKQARQRSNFFILCSMFNMLEDLKKSKYFENCNKVYILNHFMQTLSPSKRYLEKFILDHPHFHVQLPAQPRNTRRKLWKPFY